MILGITLFLRYVFSYWDLEKLYLEVPEYNFAQFASGLGRCFEIEGRLRGHFRVGGRSWDQLIVALYRDTAIRQGARLRLDHGHRTVVAPEPAIVSPVVSPELAVRDSKWSTVEWEEFVVEVATMAHVAASEVHSDTRILEDLALDSLALAELGVLRVDKYGTWSLSQDLETRSWENLTVRELYDEYLTGAPPSASATVPSDVASS